ncbi:hypothetical protein J4P90_12260 [Bacillus sp. SY8(2021)]|uniref:Uncharacterized protein n=1 Tax=Bacillus arachidis TaxID=2819290 RepID=A0ABS3NYR8_9BACI|nr:hypothetical protein [Bacillus arachidis]
MYFFFPVHPFTITSLPKDYCLAAFVCNHLR